MMTPGRLAWLAILTGLLLGAGPAFAEGAVPVAAMTTPAALHERTLAAADLAHAKLSTLQVEAQVGPSAAFKRALDAYEGDRRALLQAIWLEAQADPEVIGLTAAYDARNATYQRLAAAPDTEVLDFAQAELARQMAGERRLAALKARHAAILQDIETSTGALPTGEEFVKSLGGPFVYSEPQVVAVFGIEDPRWPDAPWQVELQWIALDAQGQPFPAVELHACGGALLTSQWVITAAHCVWDRKAGAVLTNLQVRAGSADLTGPMQTFRISEVRMPPAAIAYVPSTATAPAQNDLALLRITPSAVLTDPARIRTVRLASAEPSVIRDGLSVSGWGATVRQTLADQNQRAQQNVRLQMSPNLRVARLDPIDDGDCARRIRDRIFGQASGQPVAPLAEGMMCAGSRWSGTCQGDSGGPLVGHGDPLPTPVGARTRPLEPDDGTSLIGLVSWGVGCQDFTVFTRVWRYKPWIDSVVVANRGAR